MRYGKALVTGGAGFIGSHLAQAMLEQGLAVVVLDDLSMGRRAHVPTAARFVQGDILDTALVRRCLEDVDIVFHEAARVSIRTSLDYFDEDARTNVMGTLSVLRACAGTSVRKFVFASSMGVYSDAPGPAPVPETHPSEPLAPYGVSKLACERYLRLVGPSLAIETVSLRYFNTYGPRQSLTPYVGVMTIFINRLLHGQAPVIFGDGEQCRDFVYVGDIVRANLLAMQHGVDGQVFNIGSGRGTTVNALAALLCRRLQPGMAPVYAPAQPGELRNSVADISKAQALLGYKPRGDLEGQLDDIIAWNAARSDS